MSAYYNEFDPKAAAWLRQLIKNGDIADGTVDERSITGVCADDLKGFTQHHFFAGIGTWSYALRNARWPDDRAVCTASLPCQPFSIAGNEEGIDDDRHLLPDFLNLVRQCRFNTIFGEQVPGAIKHGWLDDLHDEMERENYAVGSVVLTAAGADKAHIRQRLYWVADATGQRPARECRKGQEGIAEHSETSGTGNSNGNGCQPWRETPEVARHGDTFNATGRDDCIEWLYCGDNKYRPIKSSIKPLVNGVARGVVYSGGAIDANDTGLARTIRIKGYGNAIVAQTATSFIKAAMATLNNKQG